MLGREGGHRNSSRLPHGAKATATSNLTSVMVWQIRPVSEEQTLPHHTGRVYAPCRHDGDSSKTDSASMAASFAATEHEQMSAMRIVL
jgi:hypothetical protein